jgi:hypothetical protein
MEIPDYLKPVTVLIEKIAGAIGVLYQPRKIVNNAKAESQANKILKLAELELRDIEQRSISRLIVEESYKQKNIENVIQKALPLIVPNATPEQISNDWIINFFDKVKTISDEDLQQMWSNILVGEANKPGKFSKKTISIVSEMDKKNALDFQNLCKFHFYLDDQDHILVYDHKDDVYRNNNINFYDLSIFETLGLLQFDPIAGFRQVNLELPIIIKYCNKQYYLSSTTSKTELSMGSVLLSPYGRELVSLCNNEFSDEILNYCKTVWKREGFDVLNEEERI